MDLRTLKLATELAQGKSKSSAAAAPRQLSAAYASSYASTATRPTMEAEPEEEVPDVPEVVIEEGDDEYVVDSDEEQDHLPNIPTLPAHFLSLMGQVAALAQQQQQQKLQACEGKGSQPPSPPGPGPGPGPSGYRRAERERERERERADRDRDRDRDRWMEPGDDASSDNGDADALDAPPTLSAHFLSMMGHPAFSLGALANQPAREPPAGLGASSRGRKRGPRPRGERLLLPVQPQPPPPPSAASSDGGPPSNPFCCVDCREDFGDFKHLLHHRRQEHPGENPYQCSLCAKCLKTRRSLTRHTRTHTGEKPFLCPVCGSAFRVKDNLAVHLRTHTGERPYTCPECNARFAHKGYLVVHMRRHTGEKPYSCSLCGTCFTGSSDLNRHMKQIHTPK